MSDEARLRINGLVARPLELTFAELAAIVPEHQVADVSRLAPQRQGDAVTLAGLLELAGVSPTAKFLGLHASRDDFHASIPLAPVRDRAVLIYRVAGKPLAVEAGGPLRFLIPDVAACHTEEIDECASLKYVDHIELTDTKGHDNRPRDDREHEELHERQ